jgi:hypothetical protein
MMSAGFRASLAAASLLLSGCVAAAVYGPIAPDQPFGYSERQREDGTYILSAVHPDSEQAMAYWDKRAAELCGSSDYVKNIYRAVRPTMMGPYGGTPGVAVFEGTLTCAQQQPAPAK